jgi:hypothetical protein
MFKDTRAGTALVTSIYGVFVLALLSESATIQPRVAYFPILEKGWKPHWAEEDIMHFDKGRLGANIVLPSYGVY